LRFLTEEWLEFRLTRLMGLSVAPGVDLRIQHVVTDGPDGEVRYYDQICDGSLVHTAIGAIEDPDFVLTRSWQVDLALHRGEVDPYNATVGGQVTVAGDEVRLLTLLPLLQDHSVALEGAARDLAAATDD
jgi:hypothetical protein